MIKEFENGNINIKLLKTDIEEIIEKWRGDFIGYISELLSWSDTYFYGDIVCLGNDCAAFQLYNVRLDKSYLLTDRDIENLKAGKAVKLHGVKPDKYQREEIENFLND